MVGITLEINIICKGSFCEQTLSQIILVDGEKAPKTDTDIRSCDLCDVDIDVTPLMILSPH